MAEYRDNININSVSQSDVHSNQSVRQSGVRTNQESGPIRCHDQSGVRTNQESGPITPSHKTQSNPKQNKKKHKESHPVQPPAEFYWVLNAVQSITNGIWTDS